MRWIGCCTSAVVLAGALGCNESSPSAAADTPAASASWLLAAEPADVRPVGEAKADAVEGDEVVVVGRIGGRVEPITSESPVFTIVDLELKHCRETKGDLCPTPWDYCCEPRESLTANSVTVQLVSPDGSPMTIDPIAAGLDPLDEIVVVGTVGPRPSPEVLVIRATAVHLRDG